MNARENPHAYDLLQRDLDNVCRYFARYGIQADAGRLAWELWELFGLNET